MTRLGKEAEGEVLEFLRVLLQVHKNLGFLETDVPPGRTKSTARRRCRSQGQVLFLGVMGLGQILW